MRKKRLEIRQSFNSVKKTLFFLFLFTHLQCVNSKNNFRIYKEETFFNNLGSEPENLHPIKSTDYYSAVIQSYYFRKSVGEK